MKNINKSFHEIKPSTKEDWRLVLDFLRFFRTAPRKILIQILKEHSTSTSISKN